MHIWSYLFAKLHSQRKAFKLKGSNSSLYSLFVQLEECSCYCFSTNYSAIRSPHTVVLFQEYFIIFVQTKDAFNSLSISQAVRQVDDNKILFRGVNEFPNFIYNKANNLNLIEYQVESHKKLLYLQSIAWLKLEFFKILPISVILSWLQKKTKKKSGWISH